KDKWDAWSIASRQILERHEIDVVYTHAQLRAFDPDELHNMALAINNHGGIHSEAYAEAVYKRLLGAIQEGGTKEEIRARLIEVLAEMRRQLGRGEVFWKET